MVEKLEAIRGGGGSIKVGATGTIGSLITRELDSIKFSSQTPKSSTRKQLVGPMSVSSSVVTPAKLHPGKMSNGIRSSSNDAIGNLNAPRTTNQIRVQKMRKSTHHIPMLSSTDTAVDKTPNRTKLEKRRPHIVDIVDIKCGNPEKAWSNPIANKFKKLTFAKLSETIG